MTDKPSLYKRIDKWIDDHPWCSLVICCGICALLLSLVMAAVAHDVGKLLW